MRRPDPVAAVAAVTTALLIGLLVVNATRGDREQVTTGAVIVVGITLALRRLRRQSSR